MLRAGGGVTSRTAGLGYKNFHPTTTSSDGGPSLIRDKIRFFNNDGNSSITTTGLQPTNFTSTSSGNGGVKSLIDKFNGDRTSNTTNPGIRTVNFVSTSTGNGGVKSLIDKFNGNGNSNSSGNKTSIITQGPRSSNSGNNPLFQRSIETIEGITRTLEKINESDIKDTSILLRGLMLGNGGLKLGLLNLQSSIEDVLN